MKKQIPIKLENERYLSASMRLQVEEHYLYSDYPLHWHEFYEIEYVASGHATETVNGIEYEVGPGFAVLLTTSDLHSFKNVSKDDPLTVYNVKFFPYLLPSELQKIMNGPASPLFGYCKDAEPIIRTLITEYYSDEPARDQFMLASLTQLCILMFRRCSESPSSDKAPEYEMLNYIKEHFLEPISVETLAGIVHLTPNYFSEFFKKHMGIGFSAYVKKLRLEFAVNLLINSDMTVNEIAHSSGFNSATHFFNSFKSIYGTTPEQFRRTRMIQDGNNDNA